MKHRGGEPSAAGTKKRFDRIKKAEDDRVHTFCNTEG